MSILINILLVTEAIVALLMMLVILMQRPKSEGLGAAFGGGVTENIFGAQTTNVLTTATTWLASIFFILVLALSILYAHRGAPDSAVRRELMKSVAPTKTASPAQAKAVEKTAPILPTAKPAASAQPTP
jgi:preprotein translocase subunit SecG